MSRVSSKPMPRNSYQFKHMFTNVAVAAGVLGSFLSFFLVFFASQSYSRFNAQYASSGSSCGRIFDICSMAQARPALLRCWANLQAPSPSRMSHSAC